MLTKTQFLQETEIAGKLNLVSKDELINAFNSKKQPSEILSSKSASFDFAKVLSLVGGGIVFLGICFLVGIYWFSLGDIGQVIVTLGSGITAFIVGSLLSYSLKQKFTGNSFHLIAGFLIPIGIFVWLSKLSPSNIGITIVASGVFLALSIIYFIFDFKLLKSNLITLFTTFYASLSYTFMFTFFFEKIDFEIINDQRLYFFASLALNISYLMLGYFLKYTSRKTASSIIFNLGFFGLLGSLLGLTIDRPILEILYVFVLSFGVYLSTRIKSGWVLAISIIYLLGYIFYLTARYFAEIIGWPVALILGGLLLIGISYFAVDLNKRFIKKT